MGFFIHDLLTNYFSLRLLFILKTKQMTNEYEPFKLLREELVKTAALFCRKITSFALLEEISELQGMCFSQNELMALNGQELISSCQIMLDKTMDHRNDLIEYGIDDQFLNLFCDQMDKFKALYHDEVTQGV
jgi:hypothetical protein